MRLAEVSAELLERPVMFPPGLARLLTRPVSTGSGVPTITIGTVFVTWAATSGGRLRGVTRISMPEAVSSSASRGSASGSPAALLYLKNNVAAGRIAEFLQPFDERPMAWVAVRIERRGDRF